MAKKVNLNRNCDLILKLILILFEIKLGKSLMGLDYFKSVISISPKNYAYGELNFNLQEGSEFSLQEKQINKPVNKFLITRCVVFHNLVVHISTYYIFVFCVFCFVLRSFSKRHTQ